MRQSCLLYLAFACFLLVQSSWYRINQTNRRPSPYRTFPKPQSYFRTWATSVTMYIASTPPHFLSLADFLLVRLGEVALPQHALQILELFYLKSLFKQLAKMSRTSRVTSTHLDINMPSILPRLLEVTQHSLDTLADHSRITSRTPCQSREDLRQPLWWWRRVGKRLHQGAET